MVLARTARRVAARGHGLRRQLTQPLQRGRRIVRRTATAVRSGMAPARNLARAAGRALGGLAGVPGGYGGGRRRRIVIRGPVSITIRPN
jgi:hypothetical protein